MKTDIEKSRWSNGIYPCVEDCGFIGPLDAFADGGCYRPCPRCGASRTNRTGRFVYTVTRNRWLPFLKKRTFSHVEWRSGY